jgi:hypothetical protein
MTASGLADAEAPPVGSLAAPHHDGSEAYVLESPEELGGEAVLRLRMPRGAAVDQVALRYTEDGEARFVVAERDAADATDEWRASRCGTRSPRTAGSSRAATSTTPG